MINERDLYLKALLAMSEEDRWAEIKCFILDWMDYVEQTPEEDKVAALWHCMKRQ